MCVCMRAWDRSVVCLCVGPECLAARPEMRSAIPTIMASQSLFPLDGFGFVTSCALCGEIPSRP